MQKKAALDIDPLYKSLIEVSIQVTYAHVEITKSLDIIQEYTKMYQGQINKTMAYR